MGFFVTECDDVSVFDDKWVILRTSPEDRRTGEVNQRTLDSGGHGTSRLSAFSSVSWRISQHSLTRPLSVQRTISPVPWQPDTLKIHAVRRLSSAIVLIRLLFRVSWVIGGVAVIIRAARSMAGVAVIILSHYSAAPSAFASVSAISINRLMSEGRRS